MIVTDKVSIKWSTFNKNYFIEKGYKFTKMNDIFEVSINDLQKNSSILIKCKCDFCGNECSVQYRYLNKVQACDKCKYKKMRKTFLEHYPTKESRKEMRKKIENTREKNTGYKSPFHDPKVREKSKQTLIKKTGYDNPWKNKSTQHERQLKIAKTLSDNQTGRTSTFQQHLATLLNAKINVNIDIYLADLAIDSYVIEYDGPGHFIYSQLSNTQDKAIQQEQVRNNVILSYGYKIIHIIAKKKPTISDKELLQLINACKNKNQDLIYLDLDNKTIGESYDYWK